MITTNVALAAEYLKKEDVIGIPTETVYGLAGNIFSKKAIEKIYSVKKRPSFNPLIVHIIHADYLKDLVTELPETAKILTEKFWPGPLTLLLKKKDIVPDAITAGKETVAIRIPNHPMAIELLNKLDFPLAAPSANPFKSISPTQAIHVENYFKEKIPLVLDGGSCKSGIESTIIGFEKEIPVVYRLGSVSIESIEQEVGEVKLFNKSNHSPDAPGMLLKHYSPNTEVLLTDNILEAINNWADKRIGVLSFYNSYNNQNIASECILSPGKDLSEAAANLYAALHRLDKENLDIILAERFPAEGLGRTINDRLERAAEKE
jgi:L-threonylcarbamoyladenylate synthase